MSVLCEKRDLSFDIAKGIGIFLVIIEHMVNFMPIWLRAYICSFHMPLFFFISGYFIKEIKDRNEFFSKLKKETASILHMYIEYSILFMLLEFIATNFDVNQLAESCGSLFRGDGGYYVLWFLFSLYLVKIIFYTINFCNERIINIVAVLIVFFGFACGKAEFNLFKIGSSCYAFGFFYLGFIFKTRRLFEKVLKAKVFLSPTYLLPLIILHYFPVVFLYKRYGYILRMVSNNSIDIICNYCIAITGIIFIVFIARGLSKYRFFSKPLAYIGKNSVYFYPLTAFVPDYCKLLLGSSALVKIVSRVISFPIAIVYMKARKRILKCLIKS